MKINATNRIKAKHRVNSVIFDIENDLIVAFAEYMKSMDLLKPKEYESFHEFVTFCSKVQDVLENAGLKKGLVVGSDAVMLDGDSGALDLDEAQLKKCLPKLASLGIKFKANSDSIIKSKIPGGIAYTTLDYSEAKPNLGISFVPNSGFI